MGEARSFSWAPNEIIKSYFLHPSPTDSRNTGVICHAAAAGYHSIKESKRMRSRYEKWRVRPNRLAVKGRRRLSFQWSGDRYCSYQFTRDSPRQVSTS